MPGSAPGLEWVVRIESVRGSMLHCNMNTDLTLQLGLDDLLADLRHARRGGDLGRLALLAYCEVRRLARKAGEPELAARSSRLITSTVNHNGSRLADPIFGRVSITNIVTSRSLSAIGSSHAPRVVFCPVMRAMTPSSMSVTPAARNVVSAQPRYP